MVWSGDDSQGGRRRVHDLPEELLCRHPDLAGCGFYLCGPPAMLAATRQMLRRLDAGPSQVACDDFKI